MFMVFIGNYIEVLDPTLLQKGCEIFALSSTINSTSDKDISTLINVASNIEIYSGNNNSSTSDDFKQKGDREFAAGRFDSAIKFYSKAVEMNSQNDNYFVNRACVHLNKENYENALWDADKAKILSKEKKNIMAIFVKARALLALEEYEAANKNSFNPTLK